MCFWARSTTTTIFSLWWMPSLRERIALLRSVAPLKRIALLIRFAFLWNSTRLPRVARRGSSSSTRSSWRRMEERVARLERQQLQASVGQWRGRLLRRSDQLPRLRESTRVRLADQTSSMARRFCGQRDMRSTAETSTVQLSVPVITALVNQQSQQAALRTLALVQTNSR